MSRGRKRKPRRRRNGRRRAWCIGENFHRPLVVEIVVLVVSPRLYQRIGYFVSDRLLPSIRRTFYISARQFPVCYVFTQCTAGPLARYHDTQTSCSFRDKYIYLMRAVTLQNSALYIRFVASLLSYRQAIGNNERNPTEIRIIFSTQSVT